MATQPKKKRSAIVIWGSFGIALCAICAAMGAISNFLSPSAPSTETAATSTEQLGTPVPPTAALAPIDQLKVNIEDVLGTSNREVPRLTSFDWSDTDKSLIINWALNDNLTSSFIYIGMQKDVADMMQEIAKSGLLPEYRFVTFVGTFPLQDAFGNASEERVVTASYNKATVDKINWDNFLWDKVFVIADSVNIHPAMKP